MSLKIIKTTVGIWCDCSGLIGCRWSFYQHFFNGQISGSSADQVHGRAAVAINQQIAEKHTGYLSDDLISRILNDYAKNQSDLKRRVYIVWYHIMLSLI